MLRGADPAPQISVAVGVVVGLAASFVQSLGLTIQRKSHLQNEDLQASLRKRDYQRPLWLAGFAIFICSNLLGTIFQIGALPIVVLGPLGAVSLLYNAFFARVILGDEFTTHLVLGTILIAGGAVLIGIFGVVPEQTHTLAELVRLYSRPAFIIWISLLAFSLIVLVSLAHVTEWALERRISNPYFPANPSTPRTRHASSLWRKHHRSPLGQMHTSPVPQYGAFEQTPTGRTTSASSAMSSVGDDQSSRVKRGSLSAESGRVSSPTREEETAEQEAKSSLSTAAIERTRLILGVAYGSASGTLSGLCLLFAKTGIELLILTVVGKNQFGHYQAWMIVLVLLVAAILQLFYLNRALRLVGPTLICPLAFCFYNLSSIISGLIYYDQWDMLSALQFGLVSLGTVILLAGVWIVSIPNYKPKHHPCRGELFSGVPLTDEPESEESESETEADSPPAVEWLPRGLTIGIGAASPGFEIRPSRHVRTATLPSPSIPSLVPTDDPYHHTIPFPRTSSDGDGEGSAADARRKRLRQRGFSLSGALYVGRTRGGESSSAPSSPLAPTGDSARMADMPILESTPRKARRGNR